jgi:hypothetical protein
MGGAAQHPESRHLLNNRLPARFVKPWDLSMTPQSYPLPQHFAFKASPRAKQNAIVHAPGVRITVLTSRLIRMEYDPAECFEDRPSQMAWYRDFSVPEFTLKRSSSELELETLYLTVRYVFTPQRFSSRSLSIYLKNLDICWHFGDEDPDNLGGTARTLDLTNGSTDLDRGLISRSGWALVDDSNTPVFDETGWIQSRKSPEKQDFYFFGYGTDYKACLRDYTRLSGSVPLLPRFALGNWWSRYWAYSQQELLNLMKQFISHKIPLSVCIIDMDWHLVDLGPKEDPFAGWTGYTWNRDLFPDPDAFIQDLHRLGLKTALNLHPADGVRRHEEAYEAMAREMDMDATTGEPISFELDTLRFAMPYFKHLHHPQEKRGVDFWWIDWQQGTETGTTGLDPLWWLNHLHFLDSGRQPEKRPFIFSRWGGLGNHRYPIGFSGDTFSTWDSLAFQPYFTATAANVGYGWWSHDIGGHNFGDDSAELYLRWVQFGVFSPVLRLHSTKNPYAERRPWAFDEETLRIVRRDMQRRHRLIPYLYTQSWYHHREGIAPIRPMYYDYPDRPEAYTCPQQYVFGDGVIAAPYTRPLDPDTKQSRQVIWFPPGEWFDLFSGDRYAGDRWNTFYGSLEDIPVFCRSGVILPLNAKNDGNGVDNPHHIEWRIFAGHSGKFDLYEDDGLSQHWQSGQYSITSVRQKYEPPVWNVILSPPERYADILPRVRSHTIRVTGITPPSQVRLTIEGQKSIVTPSVHSQSGDWSVELSEIPITATIHLQVYGDWNSMQTPEKSRLERLSTLVNRFEMENSTKLELRDKLPSLVSSPEDMAYFPDLSHTQIQACLETICEAGFYILPDYAGTERIVLWNSNNNDRITYRFMLGHNAILDRTFPMEPEGGVVPRFRLIDIPRLDSQNARVEKGQLKRCSKLIYNYFDILIKEMIKE